MAALLVLAIAAMTITGAGAQGRSDRSRPSPIQLSVEQGEADVLLKVTGLADTACSASYALEVSGGGNRSTQRGTASLRPDTPVVLVRMTLASPGGRGWSAKLSVKTCSGETFEQIEASD